MRSGSILLTDEESSYSNRLRLSFSTDKSYLILCNFQELKTTILD